VTNLSQDSKKEDDYAFSSTADPISSRGDKIHSAVAHANWTTLVIDVLRICHRYCVTRSRRQ